MSEINCRYCDALIIIGDEPPAECPNCGLFAPMEIKVLPTACTRCGERTKGTDICGVCADENVNGRKSQ